MLNCFLLSFGQNPESKARIREDTDGTSLSGKYRCSDSAAKLRAASDRALYEGDDPQVTVHKFACESREVVEAGGSIRRCAGCYIL